MKKYFHFSLKYLKQFFFSYFKMKKIHCSFFLSLFFYRFHYLFLLYQKKYNFPPFWENRHYWTLFIIIISIIIFIVIRIIIIIIINTTINYQDHTSVSVLTNTLIKMFILLRFFAVYSSSTWDHKYWHSTYCKPEQMHWDKNR